MKKRLAEYGVVPFTHIDKHPDAAGVYWMPVQGAFTTHGVHDFVICWAGIFCSLETKRPDNPQDATPLQALFQHAIRSAGGLSLVGVRDASSVDALAQFVKARLKRNQT